MKQIVNKKGVAFRRTLHFLQHFYHAKNQQMYGVKGITGILQGFTVVSLFAVVQPDGDEGQQCEALSDKEIGFSAK